MSTISFLYLIEISEVELENEELTEVDYEFIRDFGESLDSVVSGVNDEGKEVQTPNG